MAKAMSAPNIKESIAYSALVQILILPIYLYLILSLIISLAIIWFFKNFYHIKNLSSTIFLKFLEYLGLGTSLGFIVEIMVACINLSDRSMSSKVDVVVVVGVFSLVGTFCSVPSSLVAVLAKSGENLYILIINLVLIPIILPISSTIPGFFFESLCS